MFCPACGREIKEPAATLQGMANTRCTFSCSCGLDWVMNTEGFTIEAVIRNLAHLEAQNLAIHMSLMFGRDFKTTAALDRVRSEE